MASDLPAASANAKCLGCLWNFGMAATVLAMSAEGSVLEQTWNCLNADRAGHGADENKAVIPRSEATRDLLAGARRSLFGVARVARALLLV